MAYSHRRATEAPDCVGSSPDASGPLAETLPNFSLPSYEPCLSFKSLNRMKKLFLLILGLIPFWMGCSSVETTGLTKSELKAINIAVAQCPKSKATGFTQAPGYVVVVPHDTVVVFTENGEAFTVSNTPKGWKVMHRELPHSAPMLSKGIGLD